MLTTIVSVLSTWVANMLSDRSSSFQHFKIFPDWYILAQVWTYMRAKAFLGAPMHCVTHCHHVLRSSRHALCHSSPPLSSLPNASSLPPLYPFPPTPLVSSSSSYPPLLGAKQYVAIPWPRYDGTSDPYLVRPATGVRLVLTF